jgi:REP element-mobilizing transposase RayT
MPNTYSQIYIHYVFAVHSRDTSIDVQWRESLYQYIGGIVRKRKQQMIAVGGIHDHVHLLVSMNPTVSPSDLMADVKRASSKWINEKHLVPGHFAWQDMQSRKSITSFDIYRTKKNTTESNHLGRNISSF